MKVKANQQLFTDWIKLSERVRGFRTIVANDREISREDLLEWIRETARVGAEIERLSTKTLDSIKSSTEEILFPQNVGTITRIVEKD